MGVLIGTSLTWQLLYAVSVMMIYVGLSTICFRSYVSFTEKQRFIGNSAKNQIITNLKNTVWGTKSLQARQFNDKQVQSEIPRLPYSVIQQENGEVGLEVGLMLHRVPTLCFVAENHDYDL